MKNKIAAFIAFMILSMHCDGDKDSQLEQGTECIVMIKKDSATCDKKEDATKYVTSTKCGYIIKSIDSEGTLNQSNECCYDVTYVKYYSDTCCDKKCTN